jgi:hypothetical protein
MLCGLSCFDIESSFLHHTVDVFAICAWYLKSLIISWLTDISALSVLDIKESQIGFDVLGSSPFRWILLQTHLKKLSQTLRYGSRLVEAESKACYDFQLQILSLSQRERKRIKSESIERDS